MWHVWLPKHELLAVLPFKDLKCVLIPALNDCLIFMLGALSCSVLTSFQLCFLFYNILIITWYFSVFVLCQMLSSSIFLGFIFFSHVLLLYFDIISCYEQPTVTVVALLFY